MVGTGDSVVVLWISNSKQRGLDWLIAGARYVGIVVRALKGLREHWTETFFTEYESTSFPPSMYQDREQTKCSAAINH
jgi:hypothetical protein